MTDKKYDREPGFECVDPQWGDQMIRLHEADLTPAVRKGLEDHLFICDACRLSQQVEATVGEAIRAGRVTIEPGTVARPLPFPLLRWAGPTAIAASLVLMFLMPPTGRNPGGVQRDGESAPRFERPVEGEIVWGDAPELKWSPIEGATSYRVEISEVGGDFKWTGSTNGTSVQMSPENPLPDDGIFRGVVLPVPADLARPTAVTVAFSRSGWREFLRYRVKAAPVVIKGLAGVGFGVWVIGLLTMGPLWRRRFAVRS